MRINDFIGFSLKSRLLVCLLAVAVIGCNRPPAPEQPLTVDDVVARPERFDGTIVVVGEVAKVNADGEMFALGCEDACVVLPVRSAGALPAAGSTVVVRGHIERATDGRYVFVAQEVTQR